MSQFLNRRRPTTVSFSGIDGSGKSTQIEALASRAREAGLRVRIIPFWDEVAKFTSIREKSGHALFGGDKGVGRPEKPIERRDKNVQSRLMSGARLFLYSSDALSLRSVVHRSLRGDADLIIFDRYVYDELVNLRLTNPLWRSYARLMTKVVPRPDVSYFLDADPAQARARKPEYPLEFLYRCRDSYLGLSALVDGITIIPPGTVQEVERRILENLLRVIPEANSRGGVQDSDKMTDRFKQARLGGQSARTAAS